MDDQLDNDLNNRIREVFDNYEDNTADEGWLRLREKFPVKEKQRPLVWFWWASTAAALLLFVGLGYFLIDKKTPDVSMAAKMVKHDRLNPATSIKLTPITPDEVKGDSTNKSIISPNSLAKSNHPINTKLIPGNNISANSFSKQQTIAGNYPNRKTTISPSSAGTIPINEHVIADNKTSAAQHSPSDPVMKESVLKGNDSSQTPVIQSNNQQFTAITQSSTGVSIPSTAQVNSAGKTLAVNKPATAKSMEAMFANESKQATKQDEKPVDNKKVKFGVYAATFFNYAKGSSNQVNAGAGFTSDIRLSKNIKLSTGVALAQNTLRYNNSVPSNSNTINTANAVVAFAASDKQNYAVTHTAALPVLKNYDANLVGLDIPLNIKYEFNPQKSDTYVSAGLSSGTFINEAYTTSYGLPQSAVSAGALQQTTNETSRQSFNGFYFAKTLNLSFGIGTPIGKNRLIIEPFLKYPLDGLGSQQIKFGAGGLNLKLNLSKR